MEAVVGLLLLLGLCHGVDVSCDARLSGTQCYGALGGTVDVQLMDNAIGTFRFQWKKNQTNVLNWKYNKSIVNTMEDRSTFTPTNGTFRINNLNRTDGGEYKLETFNSNGNKLSVKILHLIIEAPVSSVLPVSECLSEGQVRASCSSEGGDSPQHSWTLDGRTLTDAELVSGRGESDTITLRPHVSGRLVCSVWNHVSNVSRETRTNCVFINCTLTNGTHMSQWVFAAEKPLCVEPTIRPTTDSAASKGKKTEITVASRVTPTHMAPAPWYRSTVLFIAAGLLAALIFLLVVGVVICAQMKKRKKPKEEINEEDLTYADVRIMQRSKKPAEQTEGEEVEYGQVRFSARPQQSVAPAADDCVYAKVHRDR